MLCCLALLCCGLLRAVWCLLGGLFVCSAAPLVAAVSCPVSLVVPSGWVVRGVVCCVVLVCVAVCCAVLCAPGCGAASRCCALCRPVFCCCVLCCLFCSFGDAACCAVSSGASCRPGALCFAALCFVVFPGAVCSVLCVFCRGVLARAVFCRCALCFVCPWLSRCAFPVLSGLCGAVLRCAGALALCSSCGACCCWRLVLWCAAVRCAVCSGGLWCGAGSGGLWLSAGGVFRCQCPCLAACPASLWLVRFAVVPCFPVSCSVVLCWRVVPCCRALLLFCSAVCACFALLWSVVRRRALLCCAARCLCCFFPSAGVCVLWCPFPPCWHALDPLIITLCYPTTSTAALSLMESSCSSSVESMVSSFLEFNSTWLARSETKFKNGGGEAEKGRGGTSRRIQSERARVQGRSVLEKCFLVFTRRSRSVFLYVYGGLEGKGHGVLLPRSLRCLRH